MIERVCLAAMSLRSVRLIASGATDSAFRLRTSNPQVAGSNPAGGA